MSKQIQGSLGAIPNPPDLRDIQIASVQAPVKLPKKYITDISKLEVEDQKNNGSCVGQAVAKYIQYLELKETGKIVDTSARFVYANCKKRDSLSSEGTYPRIGGDVVSSIGCATNETVEDNNSLKHEDFINVENTDQVLKDASPRKVKSYGFVLRDIESIKQAIYQNGVVVATTEVGNWNKLPVKPTPFRGNHYTIWYGFEELKNDTKIYFRNSWGKSWGKKGDGYFMWSDYVGKVQDIMTFVDLPNDYLEQIKKIPYKFTLTLKRGSRGNEVKELQKKLRETGDFEYPDITGYFGTVTENAVKSYQCKNNIVCSGTPETTGWGQVGPKTRESLNAELKPEEELLPLVAKKRDQLLAIANAVGLGILITDQYRSIEEQNELYAQGRTKPGKIVTNAKGGESLHNYKVAFDFAFLKDGKADWGEEHPWETIGKIGEVLGLGWGGWTNRAVEHVGSEDIAGWPELQDRPHFQFTSGYSIKDFQNGDVDYTKFDVKSDIIIKDEFISPIKKINMSKRVKSFLISVTSLLIPAIVAVSVTPEFSNLVGDIYNWLTSAGVPASLVIVLGLIIAEVWKSILNKRIIAKAKDTAMATNQGAIVRDLY